MTNAAHGAPHAKRDAQGVSETVIVLLLRVRATSLQHRPRDTVYHLAMSTPYRDPKKIATPPSSFVNTPLTPPPTDRKPFAQACQVIALFRARQSGKQTKQDSWIEFQLVPKEYAEIERLLSCDKPLLGYVKDKIRHVLSIADGKAANHIYAGMILT